MPWTQSPRGSRVGRFGWTLPAALVLVTGLAAAPAARASGDSIRRTSDRADADAYALALGAHMMSTNLSIEQYARMREQYAGDFLWFRRAGKAYRIEDHATLEQASALFAPLRALEPEQEDLRRREEALDKKDRILDREEEEIDRQMDRLSEAEEENDEGDDVRAADPASAAEIQALERRQADLHARQHELEARSRELDEVDRDLDAREEAIEKEAEAKLWNLIDAAVAKGLARPVAREQ